MNTIKLYNKLQKVNQTFELKKVDIGTLPYQLAFRKFMLKNGFSLASQSFANQSKLQLKFNQIYKL